MKILSIDVGILHLAIVGAEVNDLVRTRVILPEEIYFCELINITELINECNVGCKLYHEKTLCDYMMHLFQKFSQVFEDADKILIERQPLQGIVAVQELILREYRGKSTLVSPNSMHKYFQIGDYTYEQRKVIVVKTAKTYLLGFKQFCFNERQHDMADAFCIMYYHLSILKKVAQEENAQKIFQKTHAVLIENLETFRYTEKESSLGFLD